MALTNTQYDEIMRSYQERQLARQHLIAARRQEVAARDPSLNDIEGEIAHLSVQKARRLLAGDENALSGLKEEIAALSARRTALLLSLGYPADYFDPPYFCADCKDTGYIGSERCHCLKQASIDLIYAQSNLNSILNSENFSHFCLDYYGKDVFEADSDISSYAAAQNALQKCRQFVQNFDSVFDNLLLFGSTGVGKTFLSHCIAKELLDSGYSVIYFSAQQLFEQLADSTFGRTTADRPGYRDILDCDLLIIDDLGTEVSNSFTTSQFFVCLNERLLHRKPTLISTNLDLQDIASVYSERVFSRIIQSFSLLHLFGRDIRVQKATFSCQPKGTML